jgi:hypothetical protein
MRVRTNRLHSCALWLALLGAGCWKAPSRFVCVSSSQCFDSGRIGVCQPSGFCSFADGACPAGQRYHSSAGALAGQCVASAADGADLAMTTPADLAAPDLATTFADLAAPDLASAGHVTLSGAMGMPFALASSQSMTFNTTAGQFLVLAAFWEDNSGTISVFDTLGTHWTSLPAHDNVACTVQTQLWYAENIAGGSDQITVAQSASASALSFSVAEYAGIALATSLDGATGATPTTATHEMAAGSLTTTGATDLVVAAFADSQDSGTMTAGSGLRAIVSETTFYSLLEDLPPGVPPGSYAPTAELPVDNGVSAHGQLLGRGGGRLPRQVAAVSRTRRYRRASPCCATYWDCFSRLLKASRMPKSIRRSRSRYADVAAGRGRRMRRSGQRGLADDGEFAAGAGGAVSALASRRLGVAPFPRVAAAVATGDTAAAAAVRGRAVVPQVAAAAGEVDRAARQIAGAARRQVANAAVADRRDFQIVRAGNAATMTACRSRP